MERRDLIIEQEVYRYLYTNRFTRFVHFVAFKKVAKNLRNGRILDVGCGDGKMIGFLNRLSNYDYTGIDMGDEMIKKALSNFPSHTFVKCDVCAEKFPTENGKFDFIIATSVFEHLPNLEEAMKNMKAALKQKGKIIVVIPSENWLWSLGRKLTSKRHIESKFDIDYENWVREKQHVNTTKEILEKCKENFTMRKMNYFPFYLPLFIYFELTKKTKND